MSVACWKPMHGTLVLCAAFCSAILFVLLRIGEIWETSGNSVTAVQETRSHFYPFPLLCHMLLLSSRMIFFLLFVLVNTSFLQPQLRDITGSGNSQASHGVVFMEYRHSALLGTSIPAGKEFCLLCCQNKRYGCSASEEQVLCSGGKPDKEMFIGKHRNLLS